MKSFITSIALCIVCLLFVGGVGGHDLCDESVGRWPWFASGCD